MPYKTPENKRAYMKSYLQRDGVVERRKANTLAWSKANREHLRRREKIRQLTKRAQCLISYARRRASKRSIAFDLDSHVSTLQARIDAGTCELTGIPFTLDNGRQWDSPSIDRIEPSKGYVLSNVRVVLHAVNAALGDWGEGVLLKIATAMQSRRPETH